jgi:hypothetical protein
MNKPIRYQILKSVLCYSFALAAAASAQISPGQLARAHRNLNGDAHCLQCHEFSAKSPSFRCLDCHREIANEIEHDKGLHATYPRQGSPGAACIKCHSDHNGENFALVHWTTTASGFDHSKTGLVIDGKHIGVDCRACHNAKRISAAERGILTGKDLDHTWLGLSPSCITCHEDKHQGRFGTSCTQCHSTADWKTTKIDVQHFDHTKTRYPLTGIHLNVPCQKCHTSGTDGLPRYSGIQFSSCSSCHVDPHKGEFKQGCDSCHSTSTWKKSGFVTSFDHSKTQFPLLGKHIEVPCLTCHKSPDFKALTAFATCADCHHPDPHGGQFLKRSDGGRCESCHKVEGWKPSTYSAADHAKTGFPLVMPHSKVKCTDCHIPSGKETRYKINFEFCVDCHKDEHDGQFTAAPWLNRCERCHNGATFKTSNYTLALHQKASFPLKDAHEAVPCNECHKPREGSTVALYHFARLSCTSCHDDIHNGQFAKWMTAAGPGGQPLGCLSCHSTKDWKDLQKFDHSRTDFPLVGSHRAVDCIECHKPPNMELTIAHVDFVHAPTNCSECHENPHADQFGARMSDCSSCHNNYKWRPSLFDHEKTKFSLKGGHQDVACSKCHILEKPVDGKLVLFYKPTPTACSACHGSDIPALTQIKRTNNE